MARPAPTGGFNIDEIMAHYRARGTGGMDQMLRDVREKYGVAGRGHRGLLMVEVPAQASGSQGGSLAAPKKANSKYRVIQDDDDDDDTSSAPQV
jgi:hypothetical protein